MALAGALLGGTSHSVADDFFWEGGAGSAFSNADNWTVSGGEVADSPPGPGDIARIFGGNSVLSFGGDAATMNTLVQGDFQFQLNFNEYTTRLTAASGADLALIDGTVSGDFHAATGDGWITLENGDTLIEALDDFSIEDTARVFVLGGTLDGQGLVAVREVGRLFVDGGTLNADTLVIGEIGFSGDDARVILRDATFNVGTEVIVGDGGRGTLDLEDGTTLGLAATQLTLATTTSSVASVNIESGGMLSLSGPVAWGEVGLVRVDVDEGGVLNVDSLILGVHSSASLDVFGETSELNIGSGPLELALNPRSSGDFSVQEGAQVVLPGALVVGVGGNGSLRTDDGALSVAGDLIFGLDPGSDGDWSIDADESLIVEVAGDLVLGAGGDGEIEAEAENVSISAANLIIGDMGSGRAFIDGFYDSLLDIGGSSIVGNFGSGLLNLNGGEWVTGAEVVIGKDAQGDSSIWGSLVSSTSLTLGQNAPGDGTLELYAVDWSISAGLVVAAAGVAELTALSGSLLGSAFTEIGVDGAAVGMLLLSDSGTELQTGPLKVGIHGDGLLEIRSGAQVFADTVEVAKNIGAKGAILVSGSDSALEVLDGVVLDGKGDSSLRVEAGASVVSDFLSLDSGAATPVFNAIVTGAGSSWQVDRLSIGTDSVNAGLLIENGGAFECTSECVVGAFTGFAGLARVTDGGSVWDVPTDLNIGNQATPIGVGGSGRVEILDGALTDVAGATIIHHDGLFTLGSFLLDGGTLVTDSFLNNNGPFDFLDGLLDVHDGTFDNGTPSFTVDGFAADDDPILRLRDGAHSDGFTDLVTVGDQHRGTLEIQGGAKLSSRGGALGVNAGATGTATVSGVGSQWDAGIAPLTVGEFGTATLTVDDQGEVLSAGGFIAREVDSEATVSVEGIGSLWFSTLNINVGGDGLTGGGSGILSLAGGASVAAPQVTVFFPGRLEGIGSVAGDVESFGIVAPGLSPGRLAIEGDYAQHDTGELIIELGGLTPGMQYDLLEITGDAALDGTLRVRLVSDFVPELGDTFTFLTAAAVDGVFADEFVPVFAGLTLEVIYGVDFVRLATISTPVPLPTALWMFTAGAALIMRRRRQSGAYARSPAPEKILCR